ncbi:MAG: porin family protein [Bacteroidota bacterium]
MKKIILSAVAVLAFGFANAQDVKFGAKAALNVSNLDGDIDGSSLIGFQVGGFAEIKFSEKFAIQPELVYSTQGAKTEAFGPEVDIKLAYINIPVLAKYYVAKSFSVEAGPQVGFLLSADVDGEDVKDIFSSTDFGIAAGLGYDFTENLSAGVRYYLGLSNALDVSGADSKNSVLAVSVGYKF